MSARHMGQPTLMLSILSLGSSPSVLPNAMRERISFTNWPLVLATVVTWVRGGRRCLLTSGLNVCELSDVLEELFDHAERILYTGAIQKQKNKQRPFLLNHMFNNITYWKLWSMDDNIAFWHLFIRYLSCNVQSGPQCPSLCAPRISHHRRKWRKAYITPWSH